MGIMITGDIWIQNNNKDVHCVEGYKFDIQENEEQGEDYKIHKASYEDDDNGFSITFDIEEKPANSFNGTTNLEHTGCRLIKNDLRPRVGLEID
jgi:hypothetical protein